MSNTEIDVRKAIPAELKQVQDLNHELFLSDQKHFNDLNTEWPYQEVGETYFSRMIAGEIGVCFVAEVEGKLVGYLAGCLQHPHAAYLGKRAEIENMFVIETMRGKGIGEKLVKTFYDWCKEQGVDYVMVNAFTPNESAIGFYKHQGLEPYSTTLWHKV